jgi:hypothetical protein
LRLKMHWDSKPVFGKTSMESSMRISPRSPMRDCFGCVVWTPITYAAYRVT